MISSAAAGEAKEQIFFRRHDEFAKPSSAVDGARAAQLGTVTLEGIDSKDCDDLFDRDAFFQCTEVDERHGRLLCGDKWEGLLK